jgi:hypothetical protein
LTLLFRATIVATRVSGARNNFWASLPALTGLSKDLGNNDRGARRGRSFLK